MRALSAATGGGLVGRRQRSDPHEQAEAEGPVVGGRAQQQGDPSG